MSIVMMVTSNQNVVKSGKGILFTIVSPFQITVHAVGSFVQNTLTSISQLKKITEERDAIRNELEQYKQILIDFNELNLENRELRKMLDLQDTIIYESVASEVIASDPGSSFGVLILNKGSNSGIKIDMPVISYVGGKKALVGKIVEVTPLLSKVITLQNPQLEVGSIIVRNRVHTIIQGNNQKPGIVTMKYIPREYIISDQGLDYAYTSGDSFFYPRGIEIGKIVNVYQSKRYENFNQADVQITVDLAKLEYALVLLVDPEKDNFKMMDLDL
jgi:rod shape-determining protein MreC